MPTDFFGSLNHWIGFSRGRLLRCHLALCPIHPFPDGSRWNDHAPAAVHVWPQAPDPELHDEPPTDAILGPVLTATWQFNLSHTTTIKSPRGPSTSVTPKSPRGPSTLVTSKFIVNRDEIPAISNYSNKSAGFPDGTDLFDHKPESAAVCVWPQAQDYELHDESPPHAILGLVLSATWQLSFVRHNTTTTKSPKGPSTSSIKAPGGPSTWVTPKSPTGPSTWVPPKSHGVQVTKSPQGLEHSISSLLCHNEIRIRICFSQDNSPKSSRILILLQSSINIDRSFLGTHHHQNEGCWSTSSIPFTPDLRLQQEDKSDQTSSPSYTILQCPKDSASGSQLETGNIMKQLN